MGKKSTAILRLKIFAASALIPLALFTLNQFTLQIYNTAHPDLGLRLQYAVQPTVYLLYLSAALIIVIVINRRLSSLFRFLTDGSDYDRARKAALKVPWILILVNTCLWLAAITLFYSLQGFSTEGGVPYFWSLTTNSISGAISAVLAALVINRVLIPSKIALNMTEIREGERDLFIRIKIPLVFVTGFIYTVLTLIYASRFFMSAPANDVPPLPVGFGVSMTLTAVLGGTPILLNMLLSVSEDRIQRRFLLSKMKILTSGNGELGTKVSLLNFDETGALAAVINIFIDRIRNLVIKADRAGKQIVETSTDIGNLLGDLTAATGTMLEAINSVDNEMGEQEEEIIKAKAALNSFFAVLTELTDNIDSQSGSVEQTSKAAEYIAESIKNDSKMVSDLGIQTGKLNGITAQGSSHISEFIEAIKSVGESSARVEEILSRMKTLSDQIDMLAMNAAIEAAHAGDSGKGFAVVAEEVRRLSENSAEQSKQISAEMTIMTDSIDEGNKKTELADAAFQEIHDKVETTAGDFGRIIENSRSEESAVNELTATVRHLVHLTDGLRHIAETQSRQNEQIKSAIENVFSRFGGLKQSMNAQRENRDLVSNSLNRLRSITGENLEVVQELQEILKQFKL